MIATSAFHKCQSDFRPDPINSLRSFAWRNSVSRVLMRRCHQWPAMTAAARKDSVDPYRQGLALADEGRHAEAIVAFERALSVRPDHIGVLFALGRTADLIGHTSA